MGARNRKAIYLPFVNKKTTKNFDTWKYLIRVAGRWTAPAGEGWCLEEAKREGREWESVGKREKGREGRSSARITNPAQAPRSLALW